MKIKVGISNRHIHLSSSDYKILFKDQKLEKRNELSQTKEFASLSVVTIEGPKGKIDNVRVLGPFREYTQVEISKTDCYLLGIDAPVRNSGDLTDAVYINIKNNDINIKRKCAIIATRHIHINEKEKEEYNLFKEKYRIKTFGEKSSVLENIYIKTDTSSVFELHLDTDDANSNLLKNGDYVEILDD